MRAWMEMKGTCIAALSNEYDATRESDSNGPRRFSARLRERKAAELSKYEPNCKSQKKGATSLYPLRRSERLAAKNNTVNYNYTKIRPKKHN